jgi:DNA repair/transcription protein MET18/MMS19
LAPFLELNPIVSTTLDFFWQSHIANPETSPSARRSAIRAWARISKALVVRNYKPAVSYAERLFILFGDAHEEIAAEAARAIGEVPATSEVLSKANHAIIRVSLVA